MLFLGAKSEVGRAVVNKRPIGVTWEFQVYWLLIGLIVARVEENLSYSCWHSQVVS